MFKIALILRIGSAALLIFGAHAAHAVVGGRQDFVGKSRMCRIARIFANGDVNRHGSGFLIAPNQLLTAKHCLRNSGQRLTTLRITCGEQVIEIKPPSDEALDISPRDRVILELPVAMRYDAEIRFVSTKKKWTRLRDSATEVIVAGYGGQAPLRRSEIALALKAQRGTRDVDAVIQVARTFVNRNVTPRSKRDRRLLDQLVGRRQATAITMPPAWTERHGIFVPAWHAVTFGDSGGPVLIPSLTGPPHLLGIVRGIRRDYATPMVMFFEKAILTEIPVIRVDRCEYGLTSAAEAVAR